MYTKFQSHLHGYANVVTQRDTTESEKAVHEASWRSSPLGQIDSTMVVADRKGRSEWEQGTKLGI